MLYIEHRRNLCSSLSSIPSGHGLEIDIRSDLTHPHRFVVSHDPFHEQENFHDWLVEFKKNKISGPIFINTKEEGLESLIFELLKSKSIDNFLFLDSAIPTIVKYSATPQSHHFIARLSSYEALEGLKPLIGKISWLWVDCFHGRPLPVEEVKKAAADFKLCLVSPELQGFDLQEKISDFLPLAPHLSAICTKDSALWKSKI